jgi:hypothetical protein
MADALRACVDAAVLPPPIVEFWRRAHVQLKPDATRTVLRPFDLSYPEGYSNERASGCGRSWLGSPRWTTMA